MLLYNIHTHKISGSAEATMPIGYKVLYTLQSVRSLGDGGIRIKIFFILKF